jgi:polysaccharide pyruvyl transferase WcaK-like protein
MWFYADHATRELLISTQPKVLLYGGFEGFDNYGDVLQLKGTIDFHRSHADAKLILIVSMAAWTWPGFLDSMAGRYDIDGIVFEDGEHLDARSLGLDVIEHVASGGLLHVYGGGYFNRYWGERRAFVCEQILFRFHLTEYVLSGLQVDESGVASLARLFVLKLPLLVAARDVRSVELLSGVLPPGTVHFSFDDSIERIEALRRKLAQFGAVELRTVPSFGLHMNVTAEYMSAGQSQRILDTLRVVEDAKPGYSVTLVHAYNDRRNVVRDTLQSATALGILDRFVYLDVLNFATIASLHELAPKDLRLLSGALHAMEFVVSASYHVALTMNLLGVPAFLVSTNEYYDDKRAALDLETDLDRFLASPRSTIRAYGFERRERLAWLALLANSIGVALESGWSEPASTMNPHSDGPAASVSERYFV